MGRVSCVNRGRADRDRSSFHQSLKLSLLASIAGLAWAVPAVAQNTIALSLIVVSPTLIPTPAGTGGELGDSHYGGRHRTQSASHRA